MPAMTVKKLIEALGKFDGDTKIVLSKDGEGNSFSPMPEDKFYSEGVYFAENTWSGEVFWSEDECEEEERDPADGEKCIVFWPTN